MQKKYNEIIDKISTGVLALAGVPHVSDFKSFLEILSTTKSMEDKCILRKLLIFLTQDGNLDDNIEEDFDKKALFEDSSDSAKYFLDIMDYLRCIEDENKIKFFAMLCNAVIKTDLERGIFERIFKTICNCTTSELYYIKYNIDKVILEEECTITIFSLMQNGLVQKRYNEEKNKTEYYFTKYARVLYKYALNFNPKSEDNDKKLNLDNITILEDEYAINKVLQLSEPKQVEEPVIINNIETGLDFKNSIVQLKFDIESEGFKLIPYRIYFAFESSTGYVGCNYSDYINYDFKNKTYTFKLEFNKNGLKSCKKYGIVLYFILKQQKEKYIKIFHCYNGYTKQEISKLAFEQETKQLDSWYKNIQPDSFGYVSLALKIMDFDYTK